MVDALLYWGVGAAMGALFGRDRRWARLASRAAGVLALYLFSVLLISAAHYAAGTVSAELEVHPGMPADAAGVRSGDRVTAVDGQAIRSFDELRRAVDAQHGPPRPLLLQIERTGTSTRIEVTPNVLGAIGVRPQGPRAAISLGHALAMGLLLTHAAPEADGMPGTYMAFVLGHQCATFLPLFLLLAAIQALLGELRR